MHRLFVAIQPPLAIRRLLLAAMGGISKARWQTDEQLHLTLRFIGEVDRHCAEDCAAALAQVSHRPFEMALAGAGMFDRRGRPEALWVGVTPHEPLKTLHKKVDQALSRVGIAPDTRAFLPHITIARFGRGSGAIADFMATHGCIGSPAFTVDAICLYESELTSGGSVYHLAARYPF
jgi:RNA 2',3'-cyclic 3'-phosphodiesterase